MNSIPSFTRLADDITGDVITPADHGYADRGRYFYGEFNERGPQAVVQVADAEDVSKVVLFAQESDAPLAVRGGGHSILGHSSSEGGMVLDLARLESLDVDVEGRSAWAGAGLLAGEYTEQVAEHGLVTGFGDTATVGVAGITLGGGIGFLHRKLGLTIDSLLGAEIVTADGRIRRVDEENDPDLFWAIRGGGGNFGVVTRLHYQLHPVDQVVGGMLILPATPKRLSEFVEIAEGASDDLSVIGGVAVAPPLPFLPEEVHGQMVILGLMVHSGDPGTAEIEVGRFRKIAAPLVDTIDVMPYAAMFEEGGPPSPTSVSARSFFSDSFGLDDAAQVVEGLKASKASMSVVQIRVLGGAVARVPVETTAFAHRERNMVVNVVSAFEEPDDRAENEKWVTGMRRELQHGEPGVYINFHADDTIEAVHEAYPGSTWERLVDVKTKYDPHNLFASNHNIPPRGEGDQDLSR